MMLFSWLARVRVEASGGQAIELPDLPVECPGGNKAAKGAYASGCRAGGVPQLGLRVGRCRYDRLGDGGRIVADRHRTRHHAVECLPLRCIDRQRFVGLQGVRVEAGPGIRGLDEEHADAVLPELVSSWSTDS